MSPATDVCCLLANIARAGLVHCFLRLAHSQCPHGWHYHSARAMLLLTVSTICSWSALIALCSWSTSIATYMRQCFKVYHIYNLHWVIVRWWRGSCVCRMTCHSFIIASCYNKCICFFFFFPVRNIPSPLLGVRPLCQLFVPPVPRTAEQSKDEPEDLKVHSDCS